MGAPSTRVCRGIHPAPTGAKGAQTTWSAGSTCSLDAGEVAVGAIHSTHSSRNKYWDREASDKLVNVTRAKVDVTLEEDAKLRPEAEDQTLTNRGN